ncbi:MAG: sigma-70 family RNA polymerase sigma factor [Polyangiaceae bacterium]|nr:sigma-70 family RNA polymerase sigma factor [Polyangiaceae bacterium]
MTHLLSKSEALDEDHPATRPRLVSGIVAIGSEAPESSGSIPAPPSSRTRSSFRDLYERESSFVWRSLRRFGVHERDIEDKLQEVFLVAHRKFDQFEERGFGSRAWLYQIARCVASDARRHARRHPVELDNDIGATKPDCALSPEDTFEQQEVSRRLTTALLALDEDKRQLLLLYEVEGMTAPELVEIFDIPLNTVYSRLRAARELFEKTYQHLFGGAP